MSLSLRQIEAARAVAEDRLTNKQIGAAAGVTGRCIERWRVRLPEFRAEIQRHLDEASNRMLKKGLDGMKGTPEFRAEVELQLDALRERMVKKKARELAAEELVPSPRRRRR